MPASRVTLQDIADHLGLSRPTVSQALRGLGRMKPETRARVRRAAEELGYRPDPLLSAFSRHRQKGTSPGSVIALIGTAAHSLDDWLKPVADTAAKLGYRLESFSWKAYPTQKALVNVLWNRGVAGVVFIEEVDTPVLEMPLWQKLRGVFCGPYPGGDEAECPFPIVRGNLFDALHVAWGKAVAASYRRIGLLMTTKGQTQESVERKTLAAYEFCQNHEAAGLARLSPRFLRVREAGGKEIIAGTCKWLQTENPDLIITSTYLGFRHLLQCGSRIPQDFAVINLLQNPFRRDAAGLALDRVAVLNTAVCHLHAIIQHGPEMQDIHPTTIVLNPRWQDGGSFPAAR